MLLYFGSKRYHYQTKQSKIENNGKLNAHVDSELRNIVNKLFRSDLIIKISIFYF